MSAEPTNTAAEEIGKINVADTESTVKAIVKETKAGYKTTEFWGIIAVSLLDVVSQVPTKDKLVASIVAAAYALARGLAKSGVPNVEV